MVRRPVTPDALRRPDGRPRTARDKIARGHHSGVTARRRLLCADGTSGRMRRHDAADGGASPPLRAPQTLEARRSVTAGAPPAAVGSTDDASYATKAGRERLA